MSGIKCIFTSIVYNMWTKYVLHLNQHIQVENGDCSLAIGSTFSIYFPLKDFVLTEIASIKYELLIDVDHFRVRSSRKSIRKLEKHHTRIWFDWFLLSQSTVCLNKPKTKRKQLRKKRLICHIFWKQSKLF